jgi:hypothetical protein
MRKISINPTTAYNDIPSCIGKRNANNGDVGSIPAELELLTSLDHHLDFSWNIISGAIPASVGGRRWTASLTDSFCCW